MRTITSQIIQLHDCLLNHLSRRRSRKNQSSASLAFVRGIHRGPVNSPHTWPVTRKMFPFDDVLMTSSCTNTSKQKKCWKDALRSQTCWYEKRSKPYSIHFCRITLLWRHNGCDSVSNHQPHDCLLNGLFGRRSKKHESSASLAFVRGSHRGPVNSPHKWSATQKRFPFYDVIMRKWNWYFGDPPIRYRSNYRTQN